jgi:hypothetical protein
MGVLDAIDAALGTPSAGATFTPDTTANPGFVERDQTATPDQQYGPSATTVGPDGSLITGLQVYDESLMPRDAGYADDRPEFHTVQQGDTLWDISETYLGDPYSWPRLWSFNEHITNAHWIFPGDRIRLRDPDDKTADGIAPNMLTTSRSEPPPRTKRDTYLLNQFAYIEASEFETSMKVTGGAEAAVMMSTLDTLYMSYDRGKPPIPGERLLVYAPTEEVRGVKGNDVLGYVVQIMGEVEVEGVARKSAEGTVVAALNPIERGYRVGPLRRVFRRVEPTTAERSASGYVIATLTTTGPIPIKSRRFGKVREYYQLAGEEQFVVTDLGEADGVKPGNVLEVVRKGDAYTKTRVFAVPYEDGWPRRLVATLLVIEVEAETSLCVTTFAQQEFERGDHVELRGPGLGPSPTAESDRGQAEGSARANGRMGQGRGTAQGGASFRLGEDD